MRNLTRTLSASLLTAALVSGYAAPAHAQSSPPPRLSYGATMATLLLGLASAGAGAAIAGLSTTEAIERGTSARAQWIEWSAIGGAVIGLPFGVVANSWIRGRQTPIGWALLGSIAGATPGLIIAATTAREREFDDRPLQLPWGGTLRDPQPTFHESKAFRVGLGLAALGGLAGTFVGWYFGGGNEPRRSAVSLTPVVAASEHGATLGVAGTF